MIAARTPPKTGATRNNQSCESASPPANIAGPILLAGFTETPVILIPTICINVKDKPIANPAKPPLIFLVEVEPKITNKKIKVKINSATKAAVVLNSLK